MPIDRKMYIVILSLLLQLKTGFSPCNYFSWQKKWNRKEGFHVKFQLWVISIIDFVLYCNKLDELKTFIRYLEKWLGNCFVCHSCKLWKHNAFTEKLEIAYFTRVLKNDDYYHLNNMSVLCNGLRGKPGEFLEKYTPFTIKNRGTLTSAKTQASILLHRYEFTILVHTERVHSETHLPS